MRRSISGTRATSSSRRRRATGTETVFFSHTRLSCLSQWMNLPRQARDRHKESIGKAVQQRPAVSVSVSVSCREEHAILLCNFLLSFKKDAYVCLGTAMPDGDAAFVLTKEQIGNKTVWYCWNPTTGQKFLQTDPDCPLKDMGMVFNHENVWANVQDASSNICYDSLDFSDGKAWCDSTRLDSTRLHSIPCAALPCRAMRCEQHS